MACPRWCEARSARCSTNRRCTNLSTATSCHCSRPSVTCAARTGGSGSTRTSPDQPRRPPGGELGDRPLGGHRPVEGHREQPVHQLVAHPVHRRGERVVVVGPAVLGREPAAQPLQVGARPGLPRLVRGRPALPADAARRPPRPAAAPRPGGSPPGRGWRRRCRRRCPSPPPPPSAPTARSPARTPPGRRAGRRARWSSRRTWPSRRPGRRAAGRPRAAPAARVLGCGSGWPNRAHGYLSTAARTAAVRSSPVPPGPCRSIVVTMRKLCALPSNPSGSPSRSAADPVQHLLPQVPERRVPEVVGQRRGLDDVGVAAAEGARPWPRWPGRR